MLSNIFPLTEAPRKIWKLSLPQEKHSAFKQCVETTEVFVASGETIYFLGDGHRLAQKGYSMEHIDMSSLKEGAKRYVLKAIITSLFTEKGFRPYREGGVYAPSSSSSINGYNVRRLAGIFINDAIEFEIQSQEGLWLCVLPRIVVTADGELFESEFNRRNSPAAAMENKYANQKQSFMKLMKLLGGNMIREFKDCGTFSVDTSSPKDMETTFLEDSKLAFHRSNDLTAGYPLAGLSRLHPYSYNMGEAPDEIRVAYIGTSKSLMSVLKPLNAGERSFPGFKDVYMSSLVMGPERIAELSVDELRSCEDIVSIKALYMRKLQRLQERTEFDVAIVELPHELEPHFRTDKANLRHALKIEFLKQNILTQFINPDKFLSNTDSNKYYDLGLGVYVSAGNVPWKVQSPEVGECFVGISFGLSRSNQILVGLAEVFDAFGESLSLRSTSERFDRKGKGYHLSKSGLQDLVIRLLDDYREDQGGYPKKLIIHKTSHFDDAELGAMDKISQLIDSYSLVHVIEHPMVRLFNQTTEPPRGTMVKMSDRQALLYTDGYLNSAKRFVGIFAPAPLILRVQHSDQSIEQLANQVLRLTLLNWNSTRTYERAPVTLSHSKKVVNLLREGLEPDGIVRDFRYYI